MSDRISFLNDYNMVAHPAIIKAVHYMGYVG
jgi:hypothetical protein